MTTTQYVGARYVPLFKGEWDNTQAYEPLCIVSNQGNSYTSRQYVPMGIAIDNDEYWALTGNYNAQIEMYREDVNTLNNSINNILINSPYVTPEQYGAIGNGVVDDTEAFNEAFLSNKPIYVTKTYKVNMIDISNINNIIIIGNNATMFSTNTTTDKIFKSSINKHDTVILSGINFMGVDNTSCTTQPIVSIYNSEYCYVNNCSFYTNYGDGLRFEGARNVVIENCNFSNLGLKSEINGSRNGIVIYNHYYDTTVSATKIVELNIVQINNCSFSNIADECCRIDGASQINFTNNTCNNIGQDIIETANSTSTSDAIFSIKNVQVKNISRALISYSADGKSNMPHKINTVVDNVHITGLNWVNNISALARPTFTFLVVGYSTDKPINVSITNSSFESNQVEEYDAFYYFIIGYNVNISNSKFIINGSSQNKTALIEGKEINIYNSSIDFAPRNNNTNFIRCSKKANITNSYFNCLNNSEAAFVRGINLNFSDNIVNGYAPVIYMDGDCNYNRVTNNIINFMGNVTNAAYLGTQPKSSIFTNNTFIGNKPTNYTNHEGTILNVVKDNA